MIITTAYELEQEVVIKATGQVGLVSAILYNRNLEYQLVFWDKGVRRQEWVREAEVGEVPAPKPECGFKSVAISG